MNISTGTNLQSKAPRWDIYVVLPRIRSAFSKIFFFSKTNFSFDSIEARCDVDEAKHFASRAVISRCKLSNLLPAMRTHNALVSVQRRKKWSEAGWAARRERWSKSGKKNAQRWERVSFHRSANQNAQKIVVRRRFPCLYTHIANPAVPVETYHRMKSSCRCDFAATNGNCSWFPNIFYTPFFLSLCARPLLFALFFSRIPRVVYA